MAKATSRAVAKATDINLAESLKDHVPPALQQFLSAATDANLPELDINDTEALWNFAISRVHRQVAEKILSGFAFSILRQRVPRGEFVTRLKESHIALSSAYEDIEAYEMFARMPTTQTITAIAQLGPTRYLALRKVDADSLDALAKGDEISGVNLETLADLPANEVRSLARQGLFTRDAEIKGLKAEIETLRTAKESAEALAAQNAEIAAQGRQLAPNYPHFCATVREEAAVQASIIEQAIDLLSATLDEQLMAQRAERAGDVEFERYANLAASTLYHTLLAKHARIGALLQQVSEEFGLPVTEADAATFALTPAEVNALDETCRQVLGLNQIKHKQRHIDRENNRPGRRGRTLKNVVDKS